MADRFGSPANADGTWIDYDIWPDVAGIEGYRELMGAFRNWGLVISEWQKKFIAAQFGVNPDPTDDWGYSSRPAPVSVRPSSHSSGLAFDLTSATSTTGPVINTAPPKKPNVGPRPTRTYDRKGNRRF